MTSRVSRPNRQNFLLLIVLFITCLVYLPSLNNGFTNWDDDTHLLENASVWQLSGKNIKEIFTSDVNKTYIPLTELSFAVEYHFVKDKAFVYHLDNVLLHLLVVILVFAVGVKLKLSQEAALVAALIFGVHPVHVESVAWVTERKDVLYSVFYLLAMLTYIKYLEGKKGQYGLSVVFGILSVLAKPMALSLPLVLLIIDWFKGRKRNKMMVIDKLPHAIYIGIIVWQTYKHHVRVPFAQGMIESVLTWVWTLTFYIRKFIYPVELVPLYQLPKPIEMSQPEYIMAVLVFALMVFVTIKLRKNRWYMLGISLFFAMIFFLLRFDDLKENVVHDRFLYLPSLGFCWWVGAVFIEKIEKLFGVKRIITIMVSLALIGGMGAKTFHQTQIWNNSLTLWNYTIDHKNHTSITYLNRANTYNEKGMYALALQDYTRAIELDYRHAKAYNGRGLIYFFNNDYQKAIEDFNKAIEIDPKFSEVYSNRGNTYSKMGQIDRAIKDFSKSLEIEPFQWRAYVNRGSHFLLLKQYPAALKDYDQALAVNPDYIDGYFDRGKIYVYLSETDRAFADFNYVLSKAPGYGDAYLFRSYISFDKRDFKKAFDDMVKAQALAVDVPRDYQNLFKSILKNEK